MSHRADARKNDGAHSSPQHQAAGQHDGRLLYHPLHVQEAHSLQPHIDRLGSHDTPPHLGAPQHDAYLPIVSLDGTMGVFTRKPIYNRWHDAMPPSTYRADSEEPRPTLRQPPPRPNILPPTPRPPHGPLRPVPEIPSKYRPRPMVLPVPMHHPRPIPQPRPVPQPRPEPVHIYRPQVYVHREPYHPNFAVQEPYRPTFGQSETTGASANEKDLYNAYLDKYELQSGPGGLVRIQPMLLGKAVMAPVATGLCAVGRAAGLVVSAVGGGLLKLMRPRIESEAMAEIETEIESESEGETETGNEIFHDAEEHPPRTCDICSEEKPASQFVTENVTATCTHSPTSCFSCLQTWLHTSLETSNWSQATCPECSETLQYTDILRLASATTFTSYDRLLTRNLLAKDPDFRWCPNPLCSSGQLHTGGEAAPLFHCSACTYRYCIIHNTAWHEDETCTEFDLNNREPLAERRARQAKEEQASLALLKVVSKKCPGKGCDFSVQKIEGCDAMRCTRCQHKFCFQCLASYADIHAVGNSAHRWSCAHYREPGRLVWH